MPEGSGQTTKKVVKWCVRELPGYSLEFPKAFLMAATKFFFYFFGACSSSAKWRSDQRQTDRVNDFDLKLNDFKVESHCSLRRINETCSSTHKRLPPSLPVVVGVDTDTPHFKATVNNNSVI